MADGTKAGWTAGPWEASPSATHSAFWSIGTPDGDLAYLTLQANRIEANARLIAASPCMAEVLASARERLAEFIADCGGCDHEVGICMCSDHALVERIDAALARARGDAQ